MKFCRRPPSTPADKLNDLVKQLTKIMTTLDDILSKVTAEKTQIEGVLTLLAGVKQQLQDVLAGGLTTLQQEKVNQIFQVIDDSQVELKAALDANTTPPPTP